MRRLMHALSAWWGSLALVVGCGGTLQHDAPDAGHGPAGDVGAALDAISDAPLVHPLSKAPAGGDGPPRFKLDAGLLGGLPDPGPVLRALRFRDRLLYVTPDFTLRALGSDAPLAEQVYAAPVLSPDAQGLAYVALEGSGSHTRAALYLTDGAAPRLLDRTLFNLGRLRFSPDGRYLLGVGVVNGGVAGLHSVGLDGRYRCLTNCELRTGTPWRHRHVPLPDDLSAVRFKDDELSYPDPDGRERRVRLGGAP